MSNADDEKPAPVLDPTERVSDPVRGHRPGAPLTIDQAAQERAPAAITAGGTQKQGRRTRV
jgi:hypothetical protein